MRRGGRGSTSSSGFVETYGRADTDAQLGDLEIIPRRRIEYRSVVLEEMDVDAVLRRKPQLCVVDELAHTNVPGSRHEKRYQDVLELLDGGIGVLTRSQYPAPGDIERRRRPRDGRARA